MDENIIQEILINKDLLEYWISSLETIKIKLANSINFNDKFHLRCWIKHLEEKIYNLTIKIKVLELVQQLVLCNIKVALK